MRTSRFLALSAAACLATALPAQLAGPYVVGPGGNYPNIAAAITALTTSGVSAPVSFLVTANDTGPWSLGSFVGQGPTNPVLFDGRGSVTLAGAQPMLTLNGCASVTFRGFNGTYAATPSTFVINTPTADCVFTGCNFQATVATSGAALFNFIGGTGCRIEDSTFGGAYESINSGVGNDSTTVRRCRILGGGWWIMRLGGSNFTLVNNFITGTSNYGISGGISGAQNGANLKIWNNSVFINHPTAGSQYCSLRWYSSAAGTEVVNNIFCDFYPAPGVLNVWCLTTNRPSLMNYNCFWSNNAGYVPIIAGGTSYTLASWQALGFDQNSIQADPTFAAPMASPADLRLLTGSPCATTGTTPPAVAGDFFQAERSVPVSIGGHEEVGGIGASYAVFGGGCAGTLGVPSNTASATPRLGQPATITVGNLPTPLAFLAFGFSKTSWALGALPYHLDLLGAPGCSSRVSLDATILLVGTGWAAYTFVTPNQISLVGVEIHTQGLVMDPAQNALGGVTSDAATMTIGL